MTVVSLKVPIDPAALIRIKNFPTSVPFDAAVHTIQTGFSGHSGGIAE
jgi:hypothetical protein